MQLRQLLNDDDAVSPVIGVILMVAITVILAAVIAAFVLGLGGNNSVAPNPTFDYDYTAETSAGAADGVLEIDVTGGDSFTSGQVEIQGDGNADVSGNALPEPWHAASSDVGGSGSTVSAGSTATITDLSDDFEVEIIWTSEDGETSSEIGSTSGPDA